jgi:hypothetical protein
VPCASLWTILTPQMPDLALDSLTFGWICDSGSCREFEAVIFGA